MASKRITAFGGSGFLGRQIVKYLAAAGNDVRVEYAILRWCSLTDGGHHRPQELRQRLPLRTYPPQARSRQTLTTVVGLAVALAG